MDAQSDIVKDGVSAFAGISFSATQPTPPAGVSILWVPNGNGEVIVVVGP